jgi:hypothetical protein
MASDSDSELHINFYPLNPAGSSDPPGGEKMASPAMSRKPSNFEIVSHLLKSPSSLQLSTLTTS